MARLIAMDGPIRGRGTDANPAGRFEERISEAADDGWFRTEETSAPGTEVLPERARSLITRNGSPDVPFEQSINPYRGCEHGCIYCYARPAHAYVDLSPGLDFETRLFFKADAAALLEKELGRRSYRCSPIALGTNTDPYQPVEARLKVTRSLLEALARHEHPVTITTKSALVLRDLDLLTDMARRGLAAVAISVTTLDDELKHRLEPRTAAPRARLRTLRTLAEAGIPTSVLVAPVIPALNDHEMEAILDAAAAAGARRAAWILLRLPHEVADLFESWLAHHYPDRASHVMSLVRQARGGERYRSDFGQRMTGSGEYARLLGARFHRAVRRLGLEGGEEQADGLDCSRFRPPNPEASSPQLTLL